MGGVVSHPSFFSRRIFSAERLPDERADALVALLESCDAARTIRVALVNADAVPSATAERVEDVARQALTELRLGDADGAAAGADASLTWREVRSRYAHAHHLVVQIPGATPEQVADVANTVRETLRGESRANAFAGTDHAVTTGELAVGRVRLIVSTADSTFFRGEIIDELAHRAGSSAQVAAISAAAMNGQLDFAQALRKQVATLKGLSARVLVEVEENLTPSPGAIRLLRRAHAGGARLHIVSGGFAPILDATRQSYGVDEVAATDLVFNAGRLTGELDGPIVDRAAKATLLRQWAAELSTTPEACAALGNGADDLEMIHAAGLGVAYAAKHATAARADAVISNPRLDALADFLALPLVR